MPQRPSWSSSASAAGVRRPRSGSCRRSRYPSGSTRPGSSCRPARTTRRSTRSSCRSPRPSSGSRSAAAPAPRARRCSQRGRVPPVRRPGARACAWLPPAYEGHPTPTSGVVGLLAGRDAWSATRGGRGAALRQGGVAPRQPEPHRRVHGVETQALPVVDEDPARVVAADDRVARVLRPVDEVVGRRETGRPRALPLRVGVGVVDAVVAAPYRTTWLSAIAWRSYASGPRAITGSSWTFVQTFMSKTSRARRPCRPARRRGGRCRLRDERSACRRRPSRSARPTACGRRAAPVPPTNAVGRREPVRDVADAFREHLVEALVLQDEHVLGPDAVEDRVAGYRVHRTPSADVA